MQNGMNLILPSSPLSPDLGPAGHLAPEVSRVSVRHPHLGQKAGAVELGEHSGVNVIRLDLGLGERPDAEGIGDDDPPHLGLPHADDRVGVARRFQHDVVRAGHRAHAMTGRVGTDTVILDTNPIESTFATGRSQEPGVEGRVSRVRRQHAFSSCRARSCRRSGCSNCGRGHRQTPCVARRPRGTRSVSAETQAELAPRPLRAES